MGRCLAKGIDNTAWTTLRDEISPLCQIGTPTTNAGYSPEGIAASTAHCFDVLHWISRSALNMNIMRHIGDWSDRNNQWHWKGSPCVAIGYSNPLVERYWTRGKLQQKKYVAFSIWCWYNSHGNYFRPCERVSQGKKYLASFALRYIGYLGPMNAPNKLFIWKQCFQESLSTRKVFYIWGLPSVFGVFAFLRENEKYWYYIHSLTAHPFTSAEHVEILHGTWCICSKLLSAENDKVTQPLDSKFEI